MDGVRHLVRREEVPVVGESGLVVVPDRIDGEVGVLAVEDVAVEGPRDDVGADPLGGREPEPPLRRKRGQGPDAGRRFRTTRRSRGAPHGFQGPGGREPDEPGRGEGRPRGGRLGEEVKAVGGKEGAGTEQAEHNPSCSEAYESVNHGPDLKDGRTPSI